MKANIDLMNPEGVAGDQLPVSVPHEGWKVVAGTLAVTAGMLAVYGAGPVNIRPESSTVVTIASTPFPHPRSGK